MPQSLRLPDGRISVLVITADNITAELLKSAFTHERKKGFTVQTLTGSSQKVIGKLTGLKPHVALICDELQDSPHAGFKVLQKLRESHHHTAAIMLLQCFKPDCVIEAFREGARGVFSRARSLKALSKCIRTVHQGQYWASNEDLGHIMGALAHPQTASLQRCQRNAVVNASRGGCYPACGRWPEERRNSPET